MKNQLDTQFDNHTPQAPLDATHIAHSVLIAREALDFGTEHLSYDITERLRAARVRALAAPTQKTAPVAPSKRSNFNFGHWFNHLSAWLRGGIAASTVAVAFLLTFGTTQSDLESLPSSANVVAANPSGSVMASLPEIHTSRTLASSTPVNSTPNKIKRNTSPTLTTQASVQAMPATNAVASVVSDDEQVDIILREKIPLQAYLNENFNQYAERQVVDTNVPASESHNQPVSQ